MGDIINSNVETKITLLDCSDQPGVHWWLTRDVLMAGAGWVAVWRSAAAHSPGPSPGAQAQAAHSG